MTGRSFKEQETGIRGQGTVHRYFVPGTALRFCESQSSQWYAVYTCARHEMRVAEQLSLRSVEHFLPVYSSIRHWTDRSKELQLPLFPGYLFVRIALRDRLQVLEIPSVARLVGFNGAPAPCPTGRPRRSGPARSIPS